MRKRLFVPAFLAALAFAPGAAAQAGAPTVTVSPAAEVTGREAMMQLRSPVTSFHTLDMCPDPAAAALRDTVLLMADRGASAEQIVEDVVARRGEGLRLAPRQSGAGLWAWLAPPAVLLGGLALVWGKLRRLRGTAQPTVAAASPISDDERARLDAALRDYEGAEGTR